MRLMVLLCMTPDGFYEGKTKEQVYRRYLEEIYTIIRSFNDFDVLGHLGYIRRYVPYDIKAMPFKNYDDIIEAILKWLIEHGKGIEINLSGYTYRLGSAIPEADIVKRYKELGGEIITLGSDAHEPSTYWKIIQAGGFRSSSVQALNMLITLKAESRSLFPLNNP